MSWERLIKDFIDYLKIEISSSENTIAAYRRDLKKLSDFVQERYPSVLPTAVSSEILSDFMAFVGEGEFSTRSQARLLSAIRSFFKYLLMNDFIESSPASLLDAPKLGQHLPDFLTVEEIDAIKREIDLSLPDGHRNRAIIETLYSCGLRVSEACTLRLSDIDFSYSVLKVRGKGQKERFVPMSPTLITDMKNYLLQRQTQKIAKGQEDVMFLSKFGKAISRNYIFMFIRDLAARAGIEKTISPHIFRHSFATHLIEGGADVRVVQELLGHSSILTTEIYTHLDTTFLRENIIEFHPRSQK